MYSYHIHQFSTIVPFSVGSETGSLASLVWCSFVLFVESVGMGSWGLGMDSLFSVTSAGKSVAVSSEGALLVSGLFPSLVLVSTGSSLAAASASGRELDSCLSSVFEFCAVFKSSLVVVVFSACGMEFESDSGTGMESSVAEFCSAIGSSPLAIVTIAGIEALDSSLSMTSWLLVDSLVADLDFSCDLDLLLLRGGGAVWLTGRLEASWLPLLVGVASSLQDTRRSCF